MNTFISCALIIIGVFGLFGIVFKIQDDAKNELLNDMFNNKDITSETYIKYKKRL